MLRIEIKSDDLGVIVSVRSSSEQDDRTAKVKLVTCPRKCSGNLSALTLAIQTKELTKKFDDSMADEPVSG